MIKVGVYARVSTEEQKERQSIYNQIDFAKSYCQGQGYLVHDYYRDEAVSGTVPFEDRPEGKRLIEDARDKKFEIVLIWKIDRLARDTRESLTIAHILREMGISIKSMTEPFDTSTPVGEFMFTQLASMAKLERDNIRERSMTGTNRLAKTGKWLGGITPYGYKVVDGFLQPNENPLPNSDLAEAEVIRMIYKWIGEDGLSTHKVAEKLNSMNILPHYSKDGRELYMPPQNQTKFSIEEYDLRGKRKVKTTGKWHPNRIGNLVKNTTYMGIHNYGKRSNNQREIIERKVSPIVSEELWHKAQETLRNNTRWSKRNTKREYLLRGLIRCGLCGRSLTGSHYKSRKKEHSSWYRCNGLLSRNVIAYGERCKSKSLKGEWIEQLVWNEIKNWILHKESLEKILERNLRKYEKEQQGWFKNLSDIKKNIKLKEGERLKILDLYRKGLIKMEEVENQLSKIDEEKIQLENMEAELKSKIINGHSKEEIIKEISLKLDEFRKDVENDNMSFDQKRKIVETFVNDIQINLTKDKKHVVLVETIPFRQKQVIRPKKSRILETIHFRKTNEKLKRNIEQFQEDTINIFYKFPMPNNEINVFADRTDRDSSLPPT